MPQKVPFPAPAGSGCSGQSQPSEYRMENWSDKFPDTVLPAPDRSTDFSGNEAVRSGCRQAAFCAHSRYTDPRQRQAPSAEIPVRNRNAHRGPHPRSVVLLFHAPELQSLQYRKRHHHRSGKSAKQLPCPDTAPACHAPVPVRCFPECQSLSAPDTDMQSSVPSDRPHDRRLCGSCVPSAAALLS